MPVLLIDTLSGWQKKVKVPFNPACAKSKFVHKISSLATTGEQVSATIFSTLQSKPSNEGTVSCSYMCIPCYNTMMPCMIMKFTLQLVLCQPVLYPQLEFLISLLNSPHLCQDLIHVSCSMIVYVCLFITFFSVAATPSLPLTGCDQLHQSLPQYPPSSGEFQGCYFFLCVIIIILLSH